MVSFKRYECRWWAFLLGPSGAAHICYNFRAFCFLRRQFQGLLFAMQVVASMVSEIILCVKEVNQKTRAAAYELLISLAHAMHQEHPPPLAALDQDDPMGKGVHPLSFLIPATLVLLCLHPQYLAIRPATC